MMFLDFLRSRPRRVAVAAVIGLLFTLVFTGVVDLISIGGVHGGAADIVLLSVVLALVAAGAVLSGVVIHTLGELRRMHIGEREQMEELAKSEERFRLLAENARDVIYRYRISPERGFEYISPAAAAITGYTPEEHYADPELVFKMIHPEDRHLIEDSSRSLESPLESPLVLRWRRKDGQTICTEQRNKPVRDQEGNLIAVEGIARDITQRKQAEERLREREEQLRLALEASSLGLWRQDLDTGEFIASPQASIMHGLPPGTPWSPDLALRVVHPEDRDSVRERVDRAIADGGSYDSEFRVVWPDESVRWIASRGRVYEGSDGRPRSLIGVVQDVTARKQAEEALREAEEKYRGIFENSTSGIFHTTVDGRYRDANPALARLLGYDSPEELVATLTDLAHQLYENPEDRDKFTNALREHGSVKGYEVRVRRKNDTLVWLSVNARLVRDESGNTVGYEGVVEEITERKESEEALRESEEKFRSAFDSASIGMALVGLDGRWLKVNPSLCEILGYPEDALLEMAFQDITHPDDLDCNLEQQDRLISGEVRSIRLEKRYIHRLGHVVWALLDASIVRDASGEQIYHIVQVQDITRSKKDREQLQRLSRQNELILKSAGEGIYGLDPRERMTFVNPTASRMLGYEPDELVGHHQHNIIHHASPDGTPYDTEDCPIHAALQDGNVHVSSDQVFWRKDGTSFPVEYVSTPIREDGAVVGAVVTFSDITERRRTEEELARSEERFRLLAEKMSDLVCLHSPDGRYVYLSPSCRRILGYDPEDLVGVDPYDLFHPDDARRIREVPHKEALEGGTPDPIRYRIRRKSGEYIWLETLTEPILNEDGEVIRLQTSSRDVTESRRVEEALRESEERLRMTLQVSSVVLFQQDRDLRYTWVHNPQLGLSAEEMRGRTDLELLSSEDGALLTEIKTRALQTASGVREVVRMVSEGTAYYYDLTVEPLRNAVGEVVGLNGVAVDVTDRQRAEEALAEAARAKTNLLADVSHELRTPLTVIRGNADIGLELERGCAHEEILEEILRESSTMSRMVEDLLFLARSDSAAPMFRLEPVSTRSFLSALESRATLLSQKRGAVLETNLNGDGHLRIDPMRAEQAVLALVDNAARYSPAGEKVSLTSKSADGELRIEVADRGPGIPANDLPRVFDRFYRVEGSEGYRQQSGSGLGLSIAATIAEAHGGRIEAESRVGAGTRMSLYLPLLDSSRPLDSTDNQPVALQDQVFSKDI
ncbi:MAG TPA: PAS domain S-box protein [Rubrobacteraceae bacterium]|nr:PAS domain S-box protein [Rubrobacteraceae bacterium]